MGARLPDAVRTVVREALDAGMTNAQAAEAASCSIHTVSKLKAEWRAEGWEPPAPRARMVPATEQTQRARDTRQASWHEIRQQTGEIAGALAARTLGRINELVERAGQPQIVTEQARDREGNPVGVPRQRVLVPVPALEVLRLVEAAKGLFQLADRSVGISDETLQVTVASAAADSTEDRRAKVLSILQGYEDRVSGFTPAAEAG